MSQKRQRVEICRALPYTMTPLRHDFAGSFEIAPHLHVEHQLIYASRGVMTVWAEDASWVVPPHRAVWIPARTPHRVSVHGGVSMRTLYLKATLARGPSRCCVINVSSLLRELVLHACTFSGLTRRVKTQAHVIDLIVDQLQAMEVTPLELTFPRDPRGAHVARMLSDDLNDSSSLEQICRSAGASKRTIERIFVEETRLTLGRWRQQLRLLRSLHLLATGMQVSRVAVDLGYSTPSAFISMFRKAFGVTPREYFLAESERPAPRKV